jgi:dTDP-4-dehydrorhamnose 3,5-epimerase-like enzyme
MPIDDRFLYFVGGCILGFFLGYVVRTIRETKEEVEEVRDIIKNEGIPKRDERGFFNTEGSKRNWKNWVLLLVVLLSAFASFKSQAASNDVVRTQESQAETQEQLDRVLSCNQEILQKALDVLNQRSTFSQRAANTNLELQKAQKIMFDILFHIPPYSLAVREDAVKDYRAALRNFVDKANESKASAIVSSYPKAEELAACVRRATKE